LVRILSEKPEILLKYAQNLLKIISENCTQEQLVFLSQKDAKNLAKFDQNSMKLGRNLTKFDQIRSDFGDFNAQMRANLGWPIGECSRECFGEKRRLAVCLWSQIQAHTQTETDYTKLFLLFLPFPILQATESHSKE